MIILGITGGVGSGKSKVLYDLKENFGAYIIEADKLAHELMQPGMTIYNGIINEFGKEILDDEGFINRKKLGAIVFNDKEKLNLLNSISHPLVKEEILNQINEKRDKVDLFVIEAALLVEDGYNNICDEIWYIYVNKIERTRRLKLQRNYTDEQCEAMYNSQQSDEYYKANTNYLIDNSNSYEDTTKQIKARLNIIM